jgi:hypothetical protein
MMGRLKLTDDQKKKVEELFKKSEAEFRALREKRHKAFLAILTDEQKKILESMERGRGRDGRGGPRRDGPRRDRGRPPRDRGPDDRRGSERRPDPKREDVEKKIERILKEVEELRKELRRR